MYNRKPLPKTQYEISKDTTAQTFNRANEISRADDNIASLNVGLYDLDYSIKYYLENIIKPQITEFGEKVDVPVIYGAPEKWKNVQVDGYFRDKQGKILAPVIAYRRTSITKNRSLGSKVDANFPAAYYQQQASYTPENRYDQFSKLTNSKPIKTFINTVVPDYVDVTYDILIWTDYVEHMNKIVESIIYTEGTYWGEQERFKFRTKIDSFTNTTDLLADADRIIRTSFSLTLYGYIVPTALAKEFSSRVSEKTFTQRQISTDTNVDGN